MKLKVYLAEVDMSLKDFAKKLGIHPNSLWMITKGLRNPSIELAENIERLTKGKVSAKELREICVVERCPTCGKKMSAKKKV